MLGVRGPVPVEVQIRVSFVQRAAVRVLLFLFLHLPGRRDGCVAAEGPIRVSFAQRVVLRVLLQIRNRGMRSRNSPIHNNKAIRSRNIHNRGMGNPNRRILPEKLLRLKKLRP